MAPAKRKTPKELKPLSVGELLARARSKSTSGRAAATYEVGAALLDQLTQLSEQLAKPSPAARRPPAAGKKTKEGTQPETGARKPLAGAAVAGSQPSAGPPGPARPARPA